MVKGMEKDKKEMVKAIANLLEGGGLGFERRWQEGLDGETKGLLELLLAERMSYFSRKRAEIKQEQMEMEQRQFQEWKGRFMEKYPGIENDGEKFLDWLVSCQGSETEDAYLFGIREGTKIAGLVLGGQIKEAELS